MFFNNKIQLKMKKKKNMTLEIRAFKWGKSFKINFKREIWHVKPKLPLCNYFC